MQIGQPFNPYRLFIGSFIPNCLMEYEGLSSTAKLCWARLAQFAGEKGICYPSQETLAKAIGIRISRIKEVLKELEEKGFIKKIPAQGRDRLLHKTNKYIFLFHECFYNEAFKISEKQTSIESEKQPSGGSEKRLSGESEKRLQRKSLLKESLLKESYNNTYTQNLNFASSHDGNFQSSYKEDIDENKTNDNLQKETNKIDSNVNPSYKEKEKEDEKKRYLDHIMLTDNEYQNLVTRLGKETADYYIQCLNDYIHQIGIRRANAKYKSHYHVILNWKRMEDNRLKQKLLVVENLKKKEEDKWFT